MGLMPNGDASQTREFFARREHGRFARLARILRQPRSACLRMTGIVVLMLASAPAFAQGCAMCYASAKGAPADGQRAINRAILVLLAPPMGVMTLGVGLAFRYGKRRDQDNNEGE
jgi:hypothetical protein